MKKLKRLLLILSAAVALLPICGCNLISGITQGITQTPVSDYQSATEISTESLMSARTKIRQFNLSIDTQYYSQSGWMSRLAGTSLGSGVVFDSDDYYYYALTNYHVISDKIDGVRYRTSYTVTDVYGTEYTNASVVLSDGDDNDIAIIKFAKKQGATYTLPSVNYTARKDTNVSPDEFVLAVGNPSGVSNIVTYGQIIGWAQISNVSYSVINHSALINPGNSGGALCDIDGNLLGLNTWGTDGTDDDNFCVPLKQVNEIIDEFYSLYSSSAA